MLKTVTLCLALCAPAVAVANAERSSGVESDGRINLPPFDLAESSFLSEETRLALRRDRDIYSREQDERTNRCPPINLANKAKMPSIRLCLANSFYNTSLYRAMQATRS